MSARWLVAASAAFAAGGSALAAPPNDECATPSPISGTGLFNADDLTTATQSPAPAPMPGTSKDVWFCWTPNFTGVASIDVGLGSLMSAEIYPGCGCPAAGSAPLAQVASAGGVASATWAVECGQSYMIRLGAELYPSPLQGGQRYFALGSLQGEPCPPPTGQSCPSCCGAKPSYNDPQGGTLWASNYTGLIAAMTANDDSQPTAAGTSASVFPVVTIFNLQASPGAVPGGPWNPTPGAPSTAFRYARPDWSKRILGSVFGITLDDQANLYTAHSGIYGQLAPGPTGFTCNRDTNTIGSAIFPATAGPNSSTSIYKIPPGTGTPVVFANLPGGSANPDDPGLGNLHFDCGSDTLFVSHFGDGRIYRVSPTGNVLGWYDHDTDTVGVGATPDPAGPYNNFVKLGERVWAVRAHNGRLYYSVWGQNKDLFSPTTIFGTSPNRVWSVALAGGNFVAGSRQLELQTPAYPAGTGNSYALPGLTNAISDISFSSDCRMVLAERDMSPRNCTLAHSARVLEYVKSGSAWVPGNQRPSGLGYEVGSATSARTDAAGGVQYDSGPANPQNTGGKLYVTGDFQDPTTVYGFSALSAVSPLGFATRIAVDYDSTLGTQVKSQMGDIVLPCPDQACAEIIDPEILCNFPQSSGYTFTFSVKNLSTVPVTYLLLPSNPNVTISPNVVKLNTPIPVGGTSGPISITVQFNNPPGTPIPCIPIILADENFTVCCSTEYCPPELPDCDCGQFLNFNVACNPAVPGGYTVSFQLQNLSANPINTVFLVKNPPFNPAQTITPNFFNIPLLPPGGISPVLTTTIAGLTPGQPFCFKAVFTLCDNCCAVEKCFTPPPCSGAVGCYANCDGSTSVPILNALDFSCFLARWTSGQTLAQGAQIADYANCDGSTGAPVLNSLDFSCFLQRYKAGCQ